MIARTVEGRLLAAERRGNSRNGNPMYFVVVEVDGGDIIAGRTEADVARLIGCAVRLAYAATAKGIVFHRIAEVAS